MSWSHDVVAYSQKKTIYRLIRGVGNLIGGVLRQWCCAHPNFNERLEVPMCAVISHGVVPRFGRRIASTPCYR